MVHKDTLSELITFWMNMGVKMDKQGPHLNGVAEGLRIAAGSLQTFLSQLEQRNESIKTPVTESSAENQKLTEVDPVVQKNNPDLRARR